MTNEKICPRCGNNMVYREYTTDFYHLKGLACSACGYYLVHEGWVDSIKIGKTDYLPKATS